MHVRYNGLEGGKQLPLEASVVIPTYNRAGILQHCLRSYANQTYPKELFELVVVDDCSTDNTAETVEQFSKSSGIRVVYLRNDKRMGISYTRNRGIRAASGRIVIQTDSDFIATPEFVDAHVQAHKEHNVMCTGPVIHITSLDELFVKRPTIKDVCMHPLPGSNGSVARDVLIEVGGYDEDLHEYGWEDLELATRLRSRGVKSVRSEKAAGYHLHRPFTTDDLPNIRAREEARARMAVVYAKKWPTFRVRMSTWVSPVFFALDRILFAFNWISSPAVERLMERWLKSGKVDRAKALAQLYANHVYVEGLRKALQSSKNPSS